MSFKLSSLLNPAEGPDAPPPPKRPPPAAGAGTTATSSSSTSAGLDEEAAATTLASLFAAAGSSAATIATPTADTHARTRTESGASWHATAADGGRPARGPPRAPLHPHAAAAPSLPLEHSGGSGSSSSSSLDYRARTHHNHHQQHYHQQQYHHQQQQQQPQAHHTLHAQPVQPQAYRLQQPYLQVHTHTQAPQAHQAHQAHHHNPYASPLQPMAPGMAYVPAEMPFVSSSPAAEASSPIYHPHHSHNRHDSSSSSASESARRHHHQQQQLPSAHYLDDPASSSPDDGDSHDDDEGEDSDRTESDRGTAPAPLPIQHHQPLPQPQAHSKVQARLQQRQHLAPTDSEETEEEEYPHLQKVPPAPPPPPRGVVKAKSRNSTAGGRSSTTPAPQPRKKVAGKAPQNVPRKKGIAKPIKKRRKVVDEDGDMDDGSVAGDDLGETDANTMDMDNGSKLVSSPNTPPTAITPPINTIPNSYPPNSLPITPPFDPNQPVYCICRKPDSGKWMIGCDGCDDWFHGECIHIPEIDGDLVEQYYCPSCTRLGRGETSWKRKCRLQECRRPAQILGDGDGGKPSKYCSQDHGITFFEKQLLLHNNRSTISKNVLASIVLTTPDVAAFHALGERIPTPPLPADKIHAKYPESAQRLSRIREEISTLNGPVKRLLDARMAYINYAWRRREIVIDARKREAVDRGEVESGLLFPPQQAGVPKPTKQRVKQMAAAQARFEICGYDTRLGWDDDVFREWIEGVVRPGWIAGEEGKNGGEGEEAGDSNNNSNNNNAAGQDAGGGGAGGGGADEAAFGFERFDEGGWEKEDEDEEREYPPPPPQAQTQSSSSQTQAWGEHVCTKRKCGKHQFWQKVRFEEVQLEERLWEEKVSGLREEEGRIWEEVKRWWYRDAEGGREGRVVPEV